MFSVKSFKLKITKRLYEILLVRVWGFIGFNNKNGHLFVYHTQGVQRFLSNLIHNASQIQKVEENF